MIHSLGLHSYLSNGCLTKEKETKEVFACLEKYIKLQKLSSFFTTPIQLQHKLVFLLEKSRAHTRVFLQVLLYLRKNLQKYLGNKGKI